jgi:hypothetical protein
MRNIDNDQLAAVRGGFAGLLAAAGPILNGVASIIGAAKSGKGGGGGGGGGAAAAAAVSAPAPAQVQPSEDLVSVSISR